MSNTKTEYDLVGGRNWHVRRRKEILEKYPEARKLIGFTRISIFWIFLLVSTQIGLSFFLKDFPFWLILILAYFVGGFINHALLILIHECSHDLAAKKSANNRLLSIFCDIAISLPASIGFTKYHLLHHIYLGEYNYDPDIPSYSESRLIGNSTIKKFIWLCFFSISQLFRPMKTKHYRLVDAWFVLNFIVVLISDLLIFKFFGLPSLLYLFFSTFFGLGLHPAGGRWIAEHYVTTPGQETYSYYGPLNKVAFNMGFHNEHHDIMSVPWNKLPTLKKMAPEYYQNLPSYQSWVKVLFRFIFDPKMSSFNRIIHPDHVPRSKTPAIAAVTGDNLEIEPA